MNKLNKPICCHNFGCCLRDEYVEEGPIETNMGNMSLGHPMKTDFYRFSFIVGILKSHIPCVPSHPLLFFLLIGIDKLALGKVIRHEMRRLFESQNF